jgi:uncharacterized repeat protein (TIGR01451 family)
VPDTFPATHPNEQDARAACLIDLDDIPGNSAFLVNVCSYPSQQPGSDPSDCVVNPNSGFLTLVKDADPDDPAIDFDFQLTPGATDGSEQFSIAGSGARRLIPMKAGMVSVEEILADSLYLLAEATCERSNASPTGTHVIESNTVSGVEIQVGRETVCTFHNIIAEPPAGPVNLVKQVINDNGGNAGASDFTLSSALIENENSLSCLEGIAGSPTPSGTTEAAVSGELSANAFRFDCRYALSETGPAGYTQQSMHCDAGELVGNQLTLSETDVEGPVTCTIVNDDQPATITLVKEVVNDNGGDQGANDFGLSIGGTAVDSGGTLEVDSNTAITLDETGRDGYTFTEIRGEGCPATLGGTVTLDEGEAITCTIVNDDQPATITLVKQVILDDGGNETANDFGLQIGETTVSSGQTVEVDSNTEVALTEAGHAGYDFVRIEGEGCPATLGGTVNLDEGEAITCTIVNDDQPATITLLTRIVNDDGGTATGDETHFELSTSETEIAPGSTVEVEANTPVAVEEYGLAGYAYVGIEGDDGCPPRAGEAVSLDEGQAITCYVVYDDIAPTITVTKRLLPAGDTGKFNLLIDDTVHASAVGDGGSTPAVPIMAGVAHTARETGLDGAAIDDYIPTYAGDCDSNGTIANPALAQNYSCTITNRAISLTIEKQVSDSVDGPWSDSMQVFVGSEVWYRFVVTNDGAVAMENIRVTDPMLAELLGVGYAADHVFCEISRLPHEAAQNVHVCDAIGPVTAGFTPDGASINVALVEGYMDPQDHEDPTDPYIPHDPYVPNPDVGVPGTEDDDQAEYAGEFWAFTPGFWKNHYRRKDAWAWTQYETDDKLGYVFSSKMLDTYNPERRKYSKWTFSRLSLLEVLQLQGGSTVAGAMETLLRHGVTALLNASFHETLNHDPDHPVAWACEVVPEYFDGTLTLPPGMAVEMLCGSGGIVYYPLTTESVTKLVDWALDSQDPATMLDIAAGLDRYNNGIHYVDWTWPAP